MSGTEIYRWIVWLVDALVIAWMAEDIWRERELWRREWLKWALLVGFVVMNLAALSV